MYLEKDEASFLPPQYDGSETKMTWHYWLYFMVVTFSTVGFGDITA